MPERIAAPTRGLPLAARIALIAFAAAALLVGTAMATMLDGHPASSARIAWVLWSAGLVACVAVLVGTRPRRVVALAVPGVVGLLLLASIVLSAAFYPSSLDTEEAFDHATEPLTLSPLESGSDPRGSRRAAPGLRRP